MVPTKHFVYFIWADLTRARLYAYANINYSTNIIGKKVFKIGFSRNPLNRMRSLALVFLDANMSLRLMVNVNTKDHARDLERHLHLKFAQNHIAGEWFHESDQIKGFINEAEQLA